MKARSNEPIFWALFGAGGVVVAFVLPMLIFLTGVAGPLGWLPAGAFSYERMAAILTNPFGKLFVFVVISLSLWHGLHRIRLSLHDIGIHRAAWQSWLLYGFAAVCNVAAAVLVLVMPTGT
ncbi:MAG TPA: fumarate reductase subunit FrdD [Pseudomonadales bacterium]|nr:fumarate reductase subunit FrdD [Pseudomonadales bacterium]